MRHGFPVIAKISLGVLGALGTAFGLYLVLLLWANHRVAQRRPKPALVGSQLQKSSWFQVAIYHAPLPRTAPKAALDHLLESAAPLNGVESEPVSMPQFPVVWLATPSIADAAPPEGEALAYFGRSLNEAERGQLAASKAVSVLTFVALAADALPAYRRALQLVGDFAQTTGGIIWDQSTRELFSMAAWNKRGAGWDAEGRPDVLSHIAIHAYRDGELGRAITLGMRKFALPDIVLDQIPTRGPHLQDLIQLVGQRLLEGEEAHGPGRLKLAIADVRHPGVRQSLVAGQQAGVPGQAVLHVVAGEPEEGDPDNALIEIAFPGAAAARQERQAELVAQLFGTASNVVPDVKHDQELLAASAAARQTVMRFKPLYANQPPHTPGSLLVKAPFVTSSGGHEWMWVEVVRWQDRTIYGLLNSEPQQVPELKSGARVEVNEETVFDYILNKPDGTQEGNTTAAIISRSQH